MSGVATIVYIEENGAVVQRIIDYREIRHFPNHIAIRDDHGTWLIKFESILRLEISEENDTTKSEKLRSKRLYGGVNKD